MITGIERAKFESLNDLALDASRLVYDAKMYFGINTNLPPVEGAVYNENPFETHFDVTYGVEKVDGMPAADGTYVTLHYSPEVSNFDQYSLGLRIGSDGNPDLLVVRYKPDYRKRDSFQQTIVFDLVSIYTEPVMVESGSRSDSDGVLSAGQILHEAYVVFEKEVTFG